MLKLCAVLLAYPDERWIAAIPEIRAALLAEPALHVAAREELIGLLDDCAVREPLDLQALYTALFDQGRATSLQLFEHQYGDSRERGAALVALTERYAESGLVLRRGELPDALPVVLEFLSTQPVAEARAHLRNAGDALRALGGALAARGSAYAAVPRVLLAWAGAPGFSVAALKPEVPIDAEWAEPPVSFAPVRDVVQQIIHWVGRR